MGPCVLESCQPPTTQVQYPRVEVCKGQGPSDLEDLLGSKWVVCVLVGGAFHLWVLSTRTPTFVSPPTPSPVPSFLGEWSGGTPRWFVEGTSGSLSSEECGCRLGRRSEAGASSPERSSGRGRKSDLSLSRRGRTSSLGRFRIRSTGRSTWVKRGWGVPVRRSFSPDVCGQM